MGGPCGVCVECGGSGEVVCVLCAEGQGRWMVGGNVGAMGCVCCVWRGREVDGRGKCGGHGV